MTELTVLQAVRLKGRVSSTDLAATLYDDLVEVTKTVEQLTAAGLLVGEMTLRISPTDHAKLNALLDAECKGIDATELATYYHEFHSVELDFKELITNCQLKDGMSIPTRTPNTMPRFWRASMQCTSGCFRSSRWRRHGYHG